MRMLIKNGRVIDPASNTDDIRDILVEDGVIAEVAKDIDKAADTVIELRAVWLCQDLWIYMYISENQALNIRKQ